MPCIVQSNPPANVQWLFNGKDIKDYIKEGYYSKTERALPQIDCEPPMSTLRLWNINKFDRGNYTCVARNSVGESNYTFSLKIILTKDDKPEIVNENTKNIAYLGTSYNLTCEVQWPGPDPNYAGFWRRGKQVNETDRHELLPRPDGSRSNKHKMSIKNVSKEDQGLWECRAYYFDSPDGSMAAKNFSLEVAPCPKGYYCPMNESQPRPCDYGTYNDGTSNITYHCKDCPNRYKTSQRIHSAPAATSVSLCPANDNSGSKPSNKLALISSIVAGIVGVIIIVLLVAYFINKKKLGIKYMAWPDGVDTDVEIKYDVFISFSEKDQVFAKAIHNKIEENEYKCCYHHRDFSPGEYIVKNITDAIYQSTITLVILSPDYVNSRFCQSELNQALAAARGTQLRVLPVLYKPCKKLPLEVRSCLTYLEYKRADEQQFWIKLFDAIEKYCRVNRERGIETNV